MTTRNNRVSGVQSTPINPTRSINNNGDETMSTVNLSYNNVPFTLEFLGNSPEWSNGKTDWTWFGLSKECAHYSFGDFRREMIETLDCRFSGKNKVWFIKNPSITPDEILDAILECGATVQGSQPEPVKVQPKTRKQSSKVETHVDPTVKTERTEEPKAKRDIAPSTPLVSSGGIVLDANAKIAIAQIAQINVLAVLKMTHKLETANKARSSVLAAISNRMIELLDQPVQSEPVQPTPVAPKAEPVKSEPKPVQSAHSTLSPETKAKVEQIRQNATLQPSSNGSSKNYQPKINQNTGRRHCDSCGRMISMSGGEPCKKCGHVNPVLSGQPVQPTPVAPIAPKPEPVKTEPKPVQPSEIDKLNARLDKLTVALEKLSALVLSE